ncbi:Alpha/beta hydrolase domain-containing protein 17C [Paragonimus heterotremus]|uniref:Alpha/beta hydrolase domain-containing protein 17C n=1 Tax=Paragonimus heterotremus TaxID=100268 RepID=A0A8J4SVF7_9TREM|nr:Alpha/beta hydrolase domain-containing protein 17C [Paragonimus heterotremus]
MQMAGFLQSLAYRFGVNILCYDYSGYGVSTGQRLEENLYADAEAVLKELLERYQVPLEQIVLYGQSIGTAPTVDLATKYKVAGVVLHSPFMSGLRVVCPGTTRRFCFDPFTNIDKVSKILSPTLIIHGTDDEIIGIHHGRELFSRLSCPLEPAWIEGAGHNDIELFAEYATRLDRFFTEDLAGPNSTDGARGDRQDSVAGVRLSKHSSTDNSSAFDRTRSSLCHTKPVGQTSTLEQTDSISTVDTTGLSKPETCTESVDSVQLGATECELSITPNCRRNSMVSGDQENLRAHITASSTRHRILTLRKECLNSAPASRSKTFHETTRTKPSCQRAICTLPSESVFNPEEAIPRPPPSGSMMRRSSRTETDCSGLASESHLR